MALSTRKKNIIIAAWKTGEYKSFYAIAKHYKIDITTAKKILVNVPKENAHIVAAGAIYENAKKSTKNQVEIIAIEKAVGRRLRVEVVSDKLLDKIEKHITDNIKQEKINIGNGAQGFEEVGLGSNDYKNLADAIDKVSITQGVNQRHANTNLQVNTQVNSTNNLSIEDFYET